MQPTPPPAGGYPPPPGSPQGEHRPSFDGRRSAVRRARPSLLMIGLGCLLVLAVLGAITAAVAYLVSQATIVAGPSPSAPPTADAAAPAAPPRAEIRDLRE